MALLNSFCPFDTGAFPADGTNRTAGIQNVWGVPIYIKKVEMWMGMSIGGRGDFWGLCLRQSDGTKLCGTNWDHYAEPTGFSRAWYDYSPDSIVLTHGDSLMLFYGATNELPDKNGQIVVYMWWSDQP